MTPEPPREAPNPPLRPPSNPTSLCSWTPWNNRPTFAGSSANSPDASASSGLHAVRRGPNDLRRHQRERRGGTSTGGGYAASLDTPRASAAPTARGFAALWRRMGATRRAETYRQVGITLPKVGESWWGPSSSA